MTEHTHIAERERRPDDAADHAVVEGHGHPSVAEYVRVAVALAIVTALEVALFYVDFIPDGAVVSMLIVLMVIKFALVALWFMHLRFDSLTFMRLFAAGLAIALVVFAVVLATFGILIG